jgi:hypothetical protein
MFVAWTLYTSFAAALPITLISCCVLPTDLERTDSPWVWDEQWRAVSCFFAKLRLDSRGQTMKVVVNLKGSGSACSWRIIIPEFSWSHWVKPQTPFDRITCVVAGIETATSRIQVCLRHLIVILMLLAPFKPTLNKLKWAYQITSMAVCPPLITFEPIGGFPWNLVGRCCHFDWATPAHHNCMYIFLIFTCLDITCGDKDSVLDGRNQTHAGRSCMSREASLYFNFFFFLRTASKESGALPLVSGFQN